jgi:uncharacterized protein YigE (DUF2233 family)
MSSVLRIVALGGAVTILGAAVGAPALREEFGHKDAALAVRDTGGWIPWWRQDAAPINWKDQAPLARRVAWRPGVSGVEWGELQLRGTGEARRIRLAIVRFDPRRVSLSLVTAFTRDESWTVADADSGAVLALDAGQFRNTLPWGWVVSQGREVLKPEYAPLGGAVVVDSSGAVRIVMPDSVTVERERGTAWEAFQSYPMLLQDGVVPAPLRATDRGVDLAHRDARLAFGTLEDGHVIVALTRFDALGESFGRVPFGLTSPEMAAVMGALGCRHALLLDGGISGQLLVQEADGSLRSWAGARSVPMGLVGRAP